MTPIRTVGDAVATTRAALNAAGIPSAHIDARVLVGHALGMGSTDVFVSSERRLSEADAHRIRLLTARRQSREPMSYIIEEREFWSLPFRVTPATLIPRPDSETVVEAVLDYVGNTERKITILDLGVGSGCLLLSLLHELANASGVGVDISQNALAVARDNAAALGVSTRVSWVCGDWAAPIAGRFDVIIANPPYVGLSERETLSPEIRLFEPEIAVFSGIDGLASYDRILPHVPRLLNQGGRAFLEIGATQADTLNCRALRYGLQCMNIRNDHARRPRCIAFKANAFATKKSLEC